MLSTQLDGQTLPPSPRADALLTELSLYFSQFTGAEIDSAIDDALHMIPYLETNVIPPVMTMTGDILSQEITTLTKDMWLESIVLYCQKPWSRSVGMFTYKIGAGDEDLIIIPNDFMTDEGMTLTYYINRQFPIGTRFECICESTRAFGETLVKLNFR